MAVEFDDVKEIVRTVALRLDSPSSKYSFVFSESDDAVEVSIEAQGSIDPIFVFVVDAERFRVLKALDIDPEGYASFAYHSYVELLSYIVQYFYPVYFKLTNYGTLTDMLSRLLGKRIRIWKDLLRVICEKGQVEHYDRGKVFKVLGTNFHYNSETQMLSVSGELNDDYKCRTTMELIITLFTVLAYVFKLNDLEIDPILDAQIMEEGDNSLFEAEMNMGEDIDSMGMGGGDVGGDMAAGEDLSAEFVPAGDSMENTAPDMSEGKEEIMDEVMTASYRVPKGYKSIFSDFDEPGTLIEDASTSPSSRVNKREGQLLLSMAYLDSPDKINYGGLSPFYRGRNKKIGEVKVPSELKVLRDLTDAHIQVTYYEGAKPKYNNIPFSFSIGIYGCQGLATIITIRYGVDYNDKSLSGIVGISFALSSDDMLFKFEIKDPNRFSLEEVIAVLNAGVDSIDEFVLKNAILSPQQRELISEQGVY